jgi:hypothetical protein
MDQLKEIYKKHKSEWEQEFGADNKLRYYFDESVGLKLLTISSWILLSRPMESLTPSAKLLVRSIALECIEALFPIEGENDERETETIEVSGSGGEPTEVPE